MKKNRRNNKLRNSKKKTVSNTKSSFSKIKQIIEELIESKLDSTVTVLIKQRTLYIWIVGLLLAISGFSMIFMSIDSFIIKSISYVKILTCQVVDIGCPNIKTETYFAEKPREFFKQNEEVEFRIAVKSKRDNSLVPINGKDVSIIDYKKGYLNFDSNQKGSHKMPITLKAESLEPCLYSAYAIFSEKKFDAKNKYTESQSSHHKFKVVYSDYFADDSLSGHNWKISSIDSQELIFAKNMPGAIRKIKGTQANWYLNIGSIGNRKVESGSYYWFQQRIKFPIIVTTEISKSSDNDTTFILAIKQEQKTFYIRLQFKSSTSVSIWYQELKEAKQLELINGKNSKKEFIQSNIAYNHDKKNNLVEFEINFENDTELIKVKISLPGGSTKIVFVENNKMFFPGKLVTIGLSSHSSSSDGIRLYKFIASGW